MGGAKAVVSLGGRPLISYPLEALRATLDEVRVVAKPDTPLPAQLGFEIWSEPAQPSHPLVGIVHALACADGRPVLVCAADLPFVTPEVLRGLAAADPGDTPAVIGAQQGELQPLLGCYQPRAAALLQADAEAATAPVRAAVAAISPRQYEIDPAQLFNVNSPQDLRRAEAMLAERSSSA
jgi:molybdopterin-guanine dinucleotide biosynthesis protein A